MFQVRHSKHSDAPNTDPSVIGGEDWNDLHSIIGLPPMVVARAIGFADAGTGGLVWVPSITDYGCSVEYDQTGEYFLVTFPDGVSAVSLCPLVQIQHPLGSSTRLDATYDFVQQLPAVLKIETFDRQTGMKTLPDGALTVIVFGLPSE